MPLKCGAVRVVWHTHEDNAQSRAAIAKLGAQFEGLLRKHRRFGDGGAPPRSTQSPMTPGPGSEGGLLARID